MPGSWPRGAVVGVVAAGSGLAVSEAASGYLHQRVSLPLRPAKVAAIALNTRGLDESEARAAAESAEAETGLPADDPVRFGGRKILDAVLPVLQS